jgi:hypothetical protein
MLAHAQEPSCRCITCLQALRIPPTMTGYRTRHPIPIPMLKDLPAGALLAFFKHLQSSPPASLPQQA